MRHLILAICLLISTASFAQKQSVKKLVKEGEEFNKVGNYAEAGKAFAAAYDVKKDKEKYAYEAGYAYFQARDYSKAAKYFRPISKESEAWPLAGFFYGKCLKSIGKYDSAAKAFRGFRIKYPGSPDDPVLQMAEMEIAGCDLAAELEGVPEEKSAKPLFFNTNFEEYAPVPFSEDILYFSTSENGTAEIKRTRFAGGSWSDPVEPNLPAGPSGHTCHGAFSPDHSSFYFTVCISEDAPWNSRDASCEIYGTTRNGNEWTAPERLRDYLKMDGNTATHPTVVHRDGKEWIYFISDRTGGEGGLDIWYTTREIDSGSFDFTFPENAGSVINTPGDEFSPFYDNDNEKLFFSTNGHASVGGFDVYAAKGYGMKWQNPVHQGMPINSSADDYYFQKAPGGAVAFFASNRSTEDWESTTDDNIFQLGLVSNPLAQVEGRVLNRDDRQPVPGASIMVRQVGADGSEVLMTTQYTVEGGFQVPLMTGKNYKLEGLAEGFAANAIEINAEDLDPNSVLNKDIYLHAQDQPAFASAEQETTSEKSFNDSWDSVEDVNPESVTTPPVMAVTSGSMGNSTSTEVSDDANTWIDNESNSNTDFVEENFIAEDSYSMEETNDWNTTEVNKETGANPTEITETASKEMGFDVETSNTYSSNPVNEFESVGNTTTYSSSSTATETSSIPSRFDPNNNNSEVYTTGRFKNDGVTTSAPRHEGSYYKIQVSIELNYDQFAPQLNEINTLGRIDTEYIIENGWIRVMLADYFSKEEALQVLYEVRDKGFPEAFLVRYQDGYRKI